MSITIDGNVTGRLDRGQRRVACSCGDAGCEGWAWARPDLCPPCIAGQHHEHMPVWARSGSWCPCPTCDPLGPEVCENCGQQLEISPEFGWPVQHIREQLGPSGPYDTFSCTRP